MAIARALNGVELNGPVVLKPDFQCGTGAAIALKTLASDWAIGFNPRAVPSIRGIQNVDAFSRHAGRGCARVRLQWLRTEDAPGLRGPGGRSLQHAHRRRLHPAHR